MFSLSSSFTTQLVADQGFSFEGHFRHGVEGIVARPEAPQIRFPDSMPLELVRDNIEAWNVVMQGVFPGKGYYAFSAEAEMNNPGHHVLVLFADRGFCNAFLGSVESEIWPPQLSGLQQLWRSGQGVIP
ncbi:hypothetical protein EGJ28_21040 [Stutzerimonas xanthomarina]|jgi:hypothetical protein|uniref:Uncharacterized protein n=2 Tax=Stutzerimonas TaxID=2901164 RepID=A0AA40RVP9_STUST|nr:MULTISPECIES: hypothetical protein [Stutzerimonas]MBA1306691.1 hypothetical protein [Stutzerimonas stutzeri]MBK3919838.1 hypothetical protein [Stutzerimonas frequens]RRV05429.1 hypothetical protein EGJ28_21040 [Stutzerimonas xanthomarina]